MNKITFPLRLRMQGPKVGDLQATLHLIAERGIILPHDEGARRELSAALKSERADHTYGPVTRKLVSIFQKERQLGGRGAVDEPTAKALNRLFDELSGLGKEQTEFVVKGTVRFSDDSPAVGVKVSAFDRDLRNEQEFKKSCQTNKDGFYEIQYSAREFLNAEKGGADLLVKAFAADQSLLATSPVLFNAPRVAEVNLTISADVLQPPTLFEKIGSALAPLLGKVKVEELEEDKAHQDLSFLSGETGFEKSALARFVLAHTLARQAIRPEFWFVLLGGSFYTFAEKQSLKEQLPGILDALPSLDAVAVRNALTRGFNQREISEDLRKDVAAWVEAFLKFIAQRMLKGAAQPGFVKSALDDAGITGAQKQETFARLFNEHKALTPELLDALAKSGSFKKPEIANLSASFKLKELTQGNFSVVKAIKEKFGVHEPEKIRSLAKTSQEDWVKFVKARHAAGEITLPIEIKDIAGKAKPPVAELYGNMLERQFREAYPTAAFTGGLQRALQKRGAKGLQHAKVLSRFLDLHENFEFLNTPVDEFLRGKIHAEVRNAAQDKSFGTELKAIQRVFKLAPNFEATDALLADGLHSAQKVYRMGKSEFVRHYGKSLGFTPETALLAWNRAADTHAAVLTVIGDLSEFDAGILPGVLKSSHPALASFPNWNNLFKTGDLCDCEQCRSVLSPAAYFADLLMFVKDRKAKNPANTVKDILFGRRPDLGYIELNCANALTAFPYIDTVCEVLEDAVDEAGENDLELVGFNAIPAAAAAAKAAVATAFQNAFTNPANDGKEKIKLGADFSLSQVSSSDPDRWVVHGEDVSYLLKKKAPSLNFFAEILRNTKASAAELRAYPQYVNPKAYGKLRAAKYPLSLPFDLFAEEVRAAFQKTNLQRWDLMRTLRGPAAPNNPTEGEIASEYFGISADGAATFDEKCLILVADTTIPGQQTVWGETGAGWLSTVGNVKNFLQKTSLEYNELLALLDLKFINPASDITVHHLDASCDTDKKVIQVLNAAKLDRIHRFLRLWRKLSGWKMWELDLVIRQSLIGAGSLNEPFLVKLYHFSRMKSRLGVKITVEQMCALFGDMNTNTKFTELYEKRADAFYQSLFLNKRLINPLDPAFQLDTGTGDLPAGELISNHHSVLLAALGIGEADLVLLTGLTKASNGLPYIDDKLNIGNLSFLWRHAWLSKLLKLKAEDWKTLLKVFGDDLPHFANPAAAWAFVEQADQLKASGFAPDEMNWLLAADRSAKTATKETDAARFLAALRKTIQAIHAEYDPQQYDFLKATPPTDVDSLAALLTALLQKLNRDEAGTQFFISTLRDEITQEQGVSVLPAGFDFPATITGAPNNIAISYEPMLGFKGSMTPAQKAILQTDASLAAVTGLANYQQAIQELFLQPGQTPVTGLPAGFTFPVTITGAPNNIPIRYQPVLRFRGVVTAAERATLLTDPSLAAVTGIAAYQDAIGGFFTNPRLALKFFEPIFTAPLASLPAAVNFASLADAALSLKISYDAEQRVLRFAGILSNEEKGALNALSADPGYRNAVNSVASQPGLIAPPDDRIWMLDADLQFPLRDLNVPANDHLADNLATATAKALVYLSKTSAENAVVQQSAAQLGLTEALTRRLLTRYSLLPATMMEHLTGSFAVTLGVVDYVTLKSTFDGWYWASRVATILKRWKITLTELEKIIFLTASAQLLDLLTLPLDDTGALAQIDRFLRTSRLIRLRDSLPETQISLLEVLEKLGPVSYTPALFAADVLGLNDAWLAADVEALIASLDLAYPGDYLLAESWERLRRAFYFLDNLNAGANTVKKFAAAAMTFADAGTLKGLLRSKFGEETWLTLCAEIQDVLRERKRDALSAYLLAQPQPADAPSGKWENTNDLYAYYLLDVEMCSCQLTSRLVQGSGSIQLFVQRCFMGLEPEVEVKADGGDGDSAWRWWTWMRKYRVWEANRKVFLWPENWIEPELKKDRSSFFKDLENELLQNEINQYTVETAFENYLEKLDRVAQLELAGYYQEDDGDNAIVHVFGRTKGVEPHLYYYRRYDYRQWTPWEKVDLDIQGDYLIPAIVNRRLFLFWPIFTEMPDEAANSTVQIPPSPGTTGSSFKPDKTKKRLRLQMAVSDLRQGKWTPKKISKDLDASFPYDRAITKQLYQFFAVDRSEWDGRFVLEYYGIGIDNSGSIVDDANLLMARLEGVINISGCKGVPVPGGLRYGYFKHGMRPKRASTGGDKLALDTTFLRWLERLDRTDSPTNDFTFENPFATLDVFRLTQVLRQTPGLFEMTPPWHLSYFDRLLLDGNLFERRIGTWLPFFYNDEKRTFFVLPARVQLKWDRSTKAKETSVGYYPQVKSDFRQAETFFEGLVQTWLDSFNLSSLTPNQRQQAEQGLFQQFPEITPPSYTDEQFKSLLKRWFMRFFRYYLGTLSLLYFQSGRFNVNGLDQVRLFHFKNFYHPFVCDFAKLVYNPLKGISALMSRETQLKNSGFSFSQTYQPTGWVVKDPIDPKEIDAYPDEIVDFSSDGAYAPYNWELFFHAPLLIANALSRNQRFEEARDWYHFIFNPLGVESPIAGGSLLSKYWITKPFFQATDQQYVQERIDNILRMLAGDMSVPGYSAQAKKALEDQVLDWRTNPFEPHRIANYRTVAYQKTVVMKYLDNLIAWGDNLFRQDSMESINEATQLYIMAAEILGTRPKKLPPQAKPSVESFNELEDQFDKFSNALIEVENLVPQPSGNGPDGADPAPLPMLYFCIPQNDKMLGYWDTVADRLYKIRHCMNIEGIVRQLALFEPPIDPAALVKAVAGGIDITSALADLSAPLPLYRFNTLLQKANEVCNDVRALGGALLGALEKKDAEALSLLRQSQEIKLLEAVKAVREKQIEEAKENLEGVKRSKAVAETRRNYYRDIEHLSMQENLHLNKLSESHSLQENAQGVKEAASGISILPAIDIGASGFGGSPLAKFKIGGLELGQASSLASDVLSFLSQIAANDASMASSKAGFERRWDDWKLQERLAEKELNQFDSQIAAGELRIAIAEKELENHTLQIENARANDALMRSKYTNQELYEWQIGQISGVYFQNYRLAHDLAKRAERCFRFELGLQDSSYISFGYWDSLKKGLLSGEKLQYDLRRLETAYLEQNRREFELTKHVSLMLLDPLALVKLRETGRCFLNLPEEIFDLDYPGHYFRRIKSVSVTLPCVAGPYTTISCTVRLLRNSIRINTANGDNGYPRNTDEQGLPADDDRFVENNIPVKAIASSNAQNDSGAFELSFRDERYLPFEGAGAISGWSLELFSDLPANNPDPTTPDFGKPLRQFDYKTISDAVLHIKYTAREDAGPFKNGAVTHLREYFAQDGATPSLRILNLRQEFPTQWQRFLSPANPASGNVFELEMSPKLFPFRDDGKTLMVNSISLLVRGKDAANYTAKLNPPLPAPPPLGSDTFAFVQVNEYGRLHFAQKNLKNVSPKVTVDPAAPPMNWQLKMTKTPANPSGLLDPPEVEDVLLVLGYEWDLP